MGSFAGHLVPGLFFLFYGFWWMFIGFWLHVTSASRPGKGKTGGSSLSYAEFKREAELCRKAYIPQPFWPKVPIEPLFKIGLCFIGVIGEAFFDINPETGQLFAVVYKVYNQEGNFNYQGKLHHITMYLGFTLSGIIDLVALFVKVPRHTSKLFFAVAFFIEGLLFWFHVQGRPDLDLTFHVLLNYTIFASAVFAALRMWQPFNVLVNSGLSFCMILQGSWFIQLGVALYVQHWDVNDHNGQMFTIASYSWHVLGIMSAMLLFYIFMLACLRSSVKYRRGRRRGLRLISALPAVLAEGSIDVEEENRNLIEGEAKELDDLSKHGVEKKEESHA